MSERHTVTVVFDNSSLCWTESQDMNMTFLRCQQNYANDKLAINKMLFLNELYEMLGFPRTAAGQILGWVVGEGEPHYLNFNQDIHEDGSIILEFDVPGPVYNQI